MNKIDGFTKDITKENIEKLKELFPTAIKEGKIDVEELERLLGEDVASGKEQYSFTWNGKAEAEKLSQKRTTATLIPCEKESKNWDTTKNLYIEGDNLEVLRVLQNSYNNQIKMIYIDPPYNTGNDFIYKDDFADNIANYKEITGQATKSNAETQGRYHTNWLNMMYPRLKLARQLLKPDGVIFISIDDNEQANLKKLCDEIFGEDNCDTMVWRKSGVGRDGKMKNTTTFRKDHEYIIVCFKKQIMLNKSFEKPNWENDYGNPDNDYRGNYKAGSISNKEEASNPNHKNYYSVTSPGGKVFTRQFNVSKEEFLALDKDNRIYWGTDKNNVPAIKIFANEKREVTTSSYLNEIGDWNTSSIDFKKSTTTQGSKELEKLMNIENLGSEMRPKPVELIYKLIQISTNENDYILDFFSGSATTAHAVMQLNADDGGNRKFICVQLPELTDVNSEAYKAGYKNICEIGKERIRRAGEKILQELKDYADKNKKNWIDLYEQGGAYDGKIDKTKLIYLDENGNKITETKTIGNPKDIYKFHPELLDVGFKVFKLDTSNLKKWDNAPTKDENVIRDRIQQSLDYIVNGRTDLDLVYEVMLKYGIDITFPISKIESDGKKAYIINASDYQLFVCCAPQLSSKTIDEFANLSVGTYIFADRCFATDNDLVNTAEILKSKNKEMRLF